MSAIASYLTDIAYSVLDCFNCFPSNPQLKINHRSFKILRLLGEGGFSYVYLVQPTSDTSQLYALKKIRCPFGQESVAQALKEVEAYSLFAPHPNIIHSVDHCVSSDRGSGEDGQKTVYILLPYFRRGNLQDVINANLVNHTRFPEKQLMLFMLGVCRALKAMHQYRVGVTSGAADVRQARAVRREAAAADLDAAMELEGDSGDSDDGAGGGDVQPNSSRRRRARRKDKMRMAPVPQDDFDDDDADLQHEQPLMDDEVTASQAGHAPGQIRAYAHRDIKPGNIMIADDGTTPILMDLGSLTPTPTQITSRSLAIAAQDQAAEHSTMPYRAPELFDVKTDSTIDAKVDIWSLGCTMYACLVGKSPFEARSEETGGSLTMCVLGGDWRWPDEGLKGKGRTGTGGAAGGSARPVPQDDLDAGAAAAAKQHVVSAVCKDVVARCLRLEPAERPDVDQLIAILDEAAQQLPDDGI